MKKGMLALMMAFASVTAFAQRGDMTPEKRAENQTKKLTEILSLTDEQQKQIYTLNLDRAKKMEEMRAAASRDREQMRASSETFHTELAKVLTPAQQEKYKAMQEDRRMNEGRRRNN